MRNVLIGPLYEKRPPNLVCNKSLFRLTTVSPAIFCITERVQLDDEYFVTK